MRPFQIALGVLCLASAIAQPARAAPATQPSTATAPAHNFARWEKEVAAYEAQDRAHPPEKGGILFSGASTIRLWTTLADDFPGQNVINRGVGGSATIDATHFADRIIFPYAPRKIFLRTGGNDLVGGKTPQQVLGDFIDFVTTVRGKLPDTQIIFIGLSPTIKRWYQAEKEKQTNELIKAYITAEGSDKLIFLDIWDMPLGADGKPRADLLRDDQLHFNAAGYKLLAERVRPYVK